MDLRLTGKRALVTGSSSGIGAAAARMLAEEGCAVVVHGRDPARAETVAAGIREAGGTAHVALGDLATPDGADAVIAAVRAIWPDGPDILVNNAGGSAASPQAWEEIADETWLASYQKNVVAAVRLIRAFLPAMKARGWGRLIQVGSASGAQPVPVLPDYAAAKAAINNMSVALARTLVGSGVTANTVSPGRTLTPAVERAFAGRGANAAWSADQGDGGSAGAVAIGTPEDIAFAICTIASPRSGFVTGANIRVDGGQVKGVN